MQISLYGKIKTNLLADTHCRIPDDDDDYDDDDGTIYNIK